MLLSITMVLRMRMRMVTRLAFSNNVIAML